MWPLCGRFGAFQGRTAHTQCNCQEAMFANPPLVVFLVVFIILGSFGINGLLVALINESILDSLHAPDRLQKSPSPRRVVSRLMQFFTGTCTQELHTLLLTGQRSKLHTLSHRAFLGTRARKGLFSRGMYNV